MASFVEGRVYTNPKTGQPLRRVNGGWVPATKQPGPAGASPASNPALADVKFPALLPAEYRPGVTPTQVIEPNADANEMQRTPDAPQAPATSPPAQAGTYSSVPPSVAQGGKGAREEYDKKLAQWSGERDAKLLDRTREASLNAAMVLPTLDDVENLVNRAPVGAYAGVIEGVGKFIPGVTEDDDLQAIKSKMNKIILPLTTLLKGTLSDKDMQFLIDTLGSTTTSRGALIENIKMVRREARMALIKQRELQRWVALKGNPSTPDSEGRTFEDAFQEWYNNPATIKEMDKPGERTKSQQPKNKPHQYFKDRNGELRRQ